jgi:thiosulfate/3-mercaptopyruvate sulfurtransferase
MSAQIFDPEKMARMYIPRDHARPRTLVGAALTVFVAAAAALALRGAPTALVNRSIAEQTQSPDPDIPASKTIQPQELSRQLASNAKPIVVCVAPHFLYEGAHVPGAVFHGPGASPDGLKDLRQWAQAEPRDANIVIYCGCCPMSRCPNVRPALHALDEMGFSHVKVLWLATDFHTDWIEQGYPVEKGQ